MVILGDWYLKVEDNIQAKKIFTEVLAMDPDQSYINTNTIIDPRIIEKSIMIDNKNKIKLIGRPFASMQMTELFQNIIRE